jgi:hypothetical protein
MATTGYRLSTGFDLSTVFDPYVSGTQSNPTGYQDASGNDLSTRFAPYVSGPQANPTGYKLSTGSDLSTVFTPNAPSFPVSRSPLLGAYIFTSMDGPNIVVSTQSSLNAFLYWSVDFGQTLNKATISTDGTTYVEQQFFGCAAISGQYAVAMGRLTSGGANNYYFSSDYGRSYRLSSTTGQTAIEGSGTKIAISGTSAMWAVNGHPAYRANIDFSNNTATWTSVVPSAVNVDVSMFGTNAYVCCNTNNNASNGFQYSTNYGQTFTKNTNIPGAIACCKQIGTNIYVATTTAIYKLTGGPGSIPTNVCSGASLGGASGFVLAIGGCTRSSGDDFILFYTLSNGAYYSNNGGISFVLASPSLNIFPLSVHANSTRIISGGQTNSTFYWGKNAYIT